MTERQEALGMDVVSHGSNTSFYVWCLAQFMC